MNVKEPRTGLRQYGLRLHRCVSDFTLFAAKHALVLFAYIFASFLVLFRPFSKPWHGLL